MTDDIIILQNTGPLTEKDPSKLYIQIAGVNPYFDPEKGANRVTGHERNFRISKR